MNVLSFFKYRSIRALAAARTVLRVEKKSFRDLAFSRAEIATFHRLTKTQDCEEIDTQTWDDLLLDSYVGSLSPGVSIFGQQMLHQRMRGGDTSRTATVKDLLTRPILLSQLQTLCQPLRTANREISSVLFGAAIDTAPDWAKFLVLLPLAFVLALLAGACVHPICFGVALILFVLMCAIYGHFYQRIQKWDQAMHTLQMMLHVYSLLGKELTKGDAQDAQFLAPFRDNYERAARINRSLSLSLVSSISQEVRAYAEWFTLQNVRHYFLGLNTVSLHLDFLQHGFIAIANLEADLALARHLQTTQQFCWAEIDAAHRIQFDALKHPLLENAQPLSVQLHDKGVFLSGQNGIGKSTLLRTIGLNLITARAFGFCYARSAKVPGFCVYASMQNEDSLHGGESLYIAELRRAKELLEASRHCENRIFIIDEVFRGTNHLESVAASAAVLHELAKRGTVIVSSHNLVLASLLDKQLDAFCISNDGSGLALKKGLLINTNGITLLAAQGFDAHIESQANRVFAWLNSYMAYPAAYVDVLDA